MRIVMADPHSEKLRVEWVPVDRAILARIDDQRRRIRDERARAMAPAPERDLAPDATAGQGPVGLTMTEALASQGVPRLPGLTPEEEAIALLRYAAEVEHGLMAQYLYAMYSSRNAAVQGTLKRIAIEEMGHLVTVLEPRHADA